MVSHYFFFFLVLSRSFFLKTIIFPFLFFSFLPFSASLPFPSTLFISHLRQESLARNERVRIIPFNCEDGEEEQESNYEELGKQLIEEFLEMSHKNRSWQETKTKKMPTVSKRENFNHCERSRTNETLTY